MRHLARKASLCQCAPSLKGSLLLSPRKSVTWPMRHLVKPVTRFWDWREFKILPIFRLFYFSWPNDAFFGKLTQWSNEAFSEADKKWPLWPRDALANRALRKWSVQVTLVWRTATYPFWIYLEISTSLISNNYLIPLNRWEEINEDKIMKKMNPSLFIE